MPGGKLFQSHALGTTVGVGSSECCDRSKTTARNKVPFVGDDYTIVLSLERFECGAKCIAGQQFPQRLDDTVTR